MTYDLQLNNTIIRFKNWLAMRVSQKEEEGEEKRKPILHYFIELYNDS